MMMKTGLWWSRAVAENKSEPTRSDSDSTGICMRKERECCVNQPLADIITVIKQPLIISVTYKLLLIPNSIFKFPLHVYFSTSRRVRGENDGGKMSEKITLKDINAFFLSFWFFTELGFANLRRSALQQN